MIRNLKGPAPRHTMHPSITTSRVATVLGSLLCVLLPNAASAQPAWLQDRTDGDGPGIRAGALELHPSFSAEGGYDSNVFLEDQGTNGSAILRLNAGLAVTTLGAERMAEEDSEGEGSQQNVTFSGALHASYLHYFNTSNRDNVAGDLTFNLVVRPQGRVGFSIGEVFTRTVRPFVDATGAGTASYGQNTNRTTALLRIQSPGGVLRGNIGYEFGATFFDSNLFQANNSLSHSVLGSLSWTFFPRTALFWDVNAGFRNYNSDGGMPFQLIEDSRTVRTSMGVNGVLSTKFSALASMGYVVALYDGAVADDFDGMTARLEARVRPRDSVNLTFGFAHDLAPSFIGGFVRQENLYAQAQMMFAGRFLLGLQLTGSYNRSGLALQTDGVTLLGNSPHRKDFRTMAQIFGEYRATSWLAVFAHVEYQGDMTDFEYALPVAAPGAVIPDPGAGYQRVEAWLGVRVFR